MIVNTFHFFSKKSGQCFYLLFSGEISHDPCYLEIPLFKVTASSLDFVKKTPGFSRFVHNFLNTSSLLITQKSFVECRSCASNHRNLYGWFYVKKSYSQGLTPNLWGLKKLGAGVKKPCLGAGSKYFFNFRPENLRKWSNLTSIFFKWVGSNTT